MRDQPRAIVVVSSCSVWMLASPVANRCVRVCVIVTLYLLLECCCIGSRLCLHPRYWRLSFIPVTQEVAVPSGAVVRSLGRGVLSHAQCVDADADTVVVSQYYRLVMHAKPDCGSIVVLNRSDGALRAQLDHGFSCPKGLRLLAGSRVVVSNRESVVVVDIAVSNERVATELVLPEGDSVVDVLPVDDDNVVVVSQTGNRLSQLRLSDGVIVWRHGQWGRGRGEFSAPCALAWGSTSSTVLYVREALNGGRVQAFRLLQLRWAWITGIAVTTVAQQG